MVREHNKCNWRCYAQTGYGDNDFRGPYTDQQKPLIIKLVLNPLQVLQMPYHMIKTTLYLDGISLEKDVTR